MNKVLLAACMLCASVAQAEPCSYNAAIGSLHMMQDKQATRHFNGFNPGLGVECHGLQVGAYYNSLKRPTIYVGGIVYLNKWLGLKYGVATGYQFVVVPYVAGAVKISKHLEITVIPKTEYNPMVLGLSILWGGDNHE